MTQTSPDVFDTLTQSADQPREMLAKMVEHFRSERRPAELFEALKMQVRFRLGLPVLAPEDERISADDLDRQLEQGLIAACHEVGTMLIESGRVQDGWMYLRPTGDTQKAAKLIKNVPVTEENADEIIQVLLHEGVDVGHGFKLVLKRQGTCNSITLHGQIADNCSLRDQQAIAGLLLEHLYEDLCESVRADIAQQTAPADPSDSLITLLQEHPKLMADGVFHIDTSHLSNTVRIARVLEQPEHIQKAWELTQYGRRLNHSLQYPGDEPFVDFYPAHAMFYNILLGRQVEESLAVFQRRAQRSNVQEQGTIAIQTYVDLLERIGRNQEAIKATIELMPADVPAPQLTPMLLRLASKIGDYNLVSEFCRTKGDILGFTAAQSLSSVSQA